MPFKRIGEIKKATSAAYQILNGIRSGEYRVGGTLPPERVVAEQMGISRNCIREALSILQAMGIVERKVGSGTYIRSTKSDNANINETLTQVKESEDLLEIWEARKGIEQALVQLAIDRASNEELATLSEPIDVMRVSISKQDFVTYLRADTEFHIGIAQAAKNLPLENVLRSLKDVISCEVLRRMSLEYTRIFAKDCFSDHERLLRALKDRDKVAAVNEVTNHLDKLEVFLGKRMREKKGEL